MKLSHLLRMAAAAGLLLTFPPFRLIHAAEIDAAIPRTEKAGKTTFKHDAFTFVRVRFTSGHGRFGTGGRGDWSTDWPDCDSNLSATFAKETGLKTDPKGKVLELTDPALKQFPFIYMAEPGGLVFKEDEVKALRTYLMGGGFLMMDDFWGEKEWANLADQMKRVFPEREPKEIPIEHPLFHCWFDISQKPQVPNVRTGVESQYTGVTWEREDGKETHYRGIFDDQGRLMALFCHNTDLGDGWEREGENAYYFKEFSQKKAYPMGINAIVHALTQ